MTVYRKPDGTWWVRLTDDQGNAENKGPIAWKDEGTFYTHGLEVLTLGGPSANLTRQIGIG